MELDKPQTVFDAAPGTLNIYQIELTNRCSAHCAYCPQPVLKRAKGSMTMATFKATLRAMRNREVSLHHFGEPLLHPHLLTFIRYASDAGFDTGFSTNGLGLRRLTQGLLQQLADAGLMWLRIHTDPFGVRLSHFDVPAGLEVTEHRIDADNDATEKEKVSYGGFLDMPVKHDGQARCSYLKDDWQVVIYTGAIALCCVAAEGERDTSLCGRCNGFIFKGPRTWLDYDGENQ